MSLRQKRILLILSVAIALTRPLALARSLNDWDEGLFSLGVAEYDVNAHHPHPPGYPLFMAAAKGVHLLGLAEFRAVQIVVLLGGFLLFPALFFLGREIGLRFSTAAAGAALFAFLPNVWIYGGTAFSDVPSIALGFGACALLLRGRVDRRAYVLGAVVLGIAAGFRLPNLLLGAAPALIATIHRVRARDARAVALATILGGAIAGGSYLGAALASGTIEQYRFALDAQRDYVRTVDSWQNPGRAPLRYVAKVFFLWPFQQQQQLGWLAALAIFGLGAVTVQRRWGLLLPLLIFAPLMIVAWLSLDIEAAGRYAIAYLALHALFAAVALEVIGRKPVVQSVLAGAIVVVFAVWAWPALRQQRTSDAPPAAALLWVQRNVPKTAGVYVHGALGPQAAYLLPDHKVVFYDDPGEISRIAADVWLVEPHLVQGGMSFVWPRRQLWKIIRRRNFEASVLRLENLIQFADGWYQQEGSGADTFRWMQREARATLPEVRGRGRLGMRMYIPVDSIQPPPAVEVWVNDVLLERFVSAEAVVERAWVVHSRKGSPNELRIRTSEVAVPDRLSGSGDTRELGLRMDSLSWSSTP